MPSQKFYNATKDISIQFTLFHGFKCDLKPNVMKRFLNLLKDKCSHIDEKIRNKTAKTLFRLRLNHLNRLCKDKIKKKCEENRVKKANTTLKDNKGNCASSKSPSYQRMRYIVPVITLIVN